MYERLGALPHFNPDEDTDAVHPAVANLRSAIHSAAAVIFSTPEYAGALPGSFKNLLDWTIGDAHPRSIYNKPVAWINASARGAEGAHTELRTVLGYAHAAIVEDACLHIPVTGTMIGEDGLVVDTRTRDAIARLVRTLADFARCALDEVAAVGGSDLQHQ